MNQIDVRQRVRDNLAILRVLSLPGNAEGARDSARERQWNNEIVLPHQVLDQLLRDEGRRKWYPVFSIAA